MCWYANCSLGFCPWLKSVPDNSTRNNQPSGKCVRPKAIRGEERELTCVVLLLAIWESEPTSLFSVDPY